MDEVIKRLITEGYCIVSREFKLATRIDREDWIEYMALQHAPWDIKEGMEWVKRLGSRGAADHYRRVYSKDEINLSLIDYNILRGFPRSSDGTSPREYLNKTKE